MKVWETEKHEKTKTNTIFIFVVVNISIKTGLAVITDGLKKIHPGIMEGEHGNEMHIFLSCEMTDLPCNWTRTFICIMYCKTRHIITGYSFDFY